MIGGAGAIRPPITVGFGPGGRDRTFVAMDQGTATCAATLVGRVEGAWRLLAATALPAGGDPGIVSALLVDRVQHADPELAAQVGLDRRTGQPPRLESASGPAPVAVILAATEATRLALETEAAAAGWLTLGASAEASDPLVATRLATGAEVTALVVGTLDPAASGEREFAGELVALAAAVVERRPNLVVVLAGAAAGREAAFVPEARIIGVPRPRDEGGDDLRSGLAALRAGPTDTRRGLVAAAGTLAGLLGLRVELLEIGMGGALRVRAAPDAAGGPARVGSAEAPAAALGLVSDDASLDRLDGWATAPVDRARLRDRLAEIRLAPWADLEGEGAILRAAALRVATQRLVEATDAELGGPAPDLLVLAGGAWSAIPAPAALHVVADAVRRPGVLQIALDAARLLGPLGTVRDPEERSRLTRDLLRDGLVPLGTLVVPRGVRGGRAAGHLRLLAGDEPVEMDLAGGTLSLVDLPPGREGVAELSFRSAADLGVRGRRFALATTGGLAGLVVDLRDVPLRLPDRSDERRELLARWERALWPEHDA